MRNQNHSQILNFSKIWIDYMNSQEKYSIDTEDIDFVRYILVTGYANIIITKH